MEYMLKKPLADRIDQLEQRHNRLARLVYASLFVAVVAVSVAVAALVFSLSMMHFDQTSSNTGKEGAQNAAVSAGIEDIIHHDAGAVGAPKGTQVSGSEEAPAPAASAEEAPAPAASAEEAPAPAASAEEDAQHAAVGGAGSCCRDAMQRVANLEELFEARTVAETEQDKGIAQLENKVTVVESFIGLPYEQVGEEMRSNPRIEVVTRSDKEKNDIWFANVANTTAAVEDYVYDYEYDGSGVIFVDEEESHVVEEMEGSGSGMEPVISDDEELSASRCPKFPRPVCPNGCVTEEFGNNGCPFFVCCRSRLYS